MTKVPLHVPRFVVYARGRALHLLPGIDALRAHVFAAERIHADDTVVPLLANGKTRTGRLWACVRNDEPFARPETPAA